MMDELEMRQNICGGSERVNVDETKAKVEKLNRESSLAFNRL